MKSIGDAMEWGRNFLAEFKFEDPAVEVRALLSGLMNVSPTQLHLHRDETLDDLVWKKFQIAIGRRSTREPVAYILGKSSFVGMDLEVGPSVLIPRPETELLAQAAIRLIQNENWTEPKILDVGTGSGALALALAHAVPGAEITALDVSAQALEVARRNAKNQGLSKRVFFTESNLFEWFRQGSWGGYFDMIISNPPYISSSFLSHLDPDLKFEPALALDGGPEGLSVLTPLVQEAPNYLKSSGILLVEIGFDQGARVEQLFKSGGFNHIQVQKDDAQWDRIVCGWKTIRTAPDRQLLLNV